MNHVGRAVAVIREARNMTQRELGYVVGIDASYISLIEAGRRAPRSHNLNKIAEGLRVAPHTLMLLGSAREELERLPSDMRRALAEELLAVFTQGDNEGALPDNPDEVDTMTTSDDAPDFDQWRR